ncbi:N terminus of Rad21 [Histomonas meleagridis]|uniref:N terminus of Rad21 n=1 Tax=Histomonas meleagridis TaxID=135588 RepID=UPI00355A2404|nr:N terminus of Rad21 [Histomonas meleagridis]KAH0804336.1 N terminus of Rad21 [Histomonas meleagridis]
MSAVSDLLLKKGNLSSVWIAGTMKDKLGKKVILQTDITSVANQIMDNVQINLVLRVSGMLLKGLVVVYSKKTQYMLVDCEEIISKIMQSFKPDAVNLPSNKRITLDAATVPLGKEVPKTETIDLDQWIIAQNPEQTFSIQAIPIEFSVSDSSQTLTQLSDSGYSSSSVQSSQIFQSDHDFGESPIQLQPIEKMPSAPLVPEWVDLPESEYEAPPQLDFDDTSTTEVEEEKTRARIVDSSIDLPDKKTTQRKRVRSSVASHRRVILPQNEELENLFEIAKQQFVKPPIKEPESDDFQGFGGLSDDDIEIERTRDAEIPMPIPEDIDESSRPSLSGSDIEFEPRRSSLSGITTPSFGGEKHTFNLESPFPNFKFAVEATPRKSVEDSITNNTIKTLNKLRKAMGDSESITFDKAFGGSSRHGAAYAFYQMLVLGSTGAIKINQEEPYGQIEIIPGERFKR